MLHQIGAGSLGPVFRGEDPARAEPVAIKALRLDLPPERCRQVADQLAGLAARLPVHHSVIAPVDAGLAELAPYVVWPLLEGTSLDVALREYGPAACMDALPRLAALADALDRAAANGVWHGALHPRDVIVADEETWVIGLGIAPILERAGVRLPARRPYTAPEQLEGHATSPQSDQFALAAIAHEWLFGRRVAGPANESLSIPQLPGVDRTRMTDAFCAGLAVPPADRFQSAAKFVRALERSVIDHHEAKIESMARAARRQARAAAPVVPTLPLEAVTADVEQAPFQDLEGDDHDPLDRMTAGEPAPPVITLDADEGLHLAPEDLEADALSGFPVSDHDATEHRPRGTHDADVHPRTDADEGGDDPDRRDAGAYAEADSANGFREEEPAGRRAPTIVTAGAPGEPHMFSHERASSGGGYGAGTVIAGLFVGMVLGMAAGYGFALRQPATAAIEEEGAVAAPAATATDATAGSAAGQPYTDATLPPASPVAVPPPVGAAASAAVTPAPEAAPAAAEERPGRLLIRTTPAGAQVRVDGELRGATPLTLRDLALGTHTVTISREGFQPSEHRVALTTARPSRSLDVPLGRPAAATPPVPSAPAARPAAPAATTGSLLVESRPAGAAVRIDDRPVGTTPVTVPALAPGSYRVTIAREGYQAWTTTVRVTAGERARVAASLVGGRLEE